MRRAKPPWVCAFAVLLFGCGTEAIDHPSASAGFSGTDSFGGSGEVSATSVASAVGNFPEPVQTRCGPLPPDVMPIDTLLSAWAVLALPGSRDADGVDVETGSIRLRLSDIPLDSCASPFFVDSGNCGENPNGDPLACGWGTSFTLGPDESTPGTTALEDLIDPSYAVSILGDNAGRTDRTGTLELFRVTADCIVGELRDVETYPGEPPQNGGFIAEVCQRQCIPNANGGC